MKVGVRPFVRTYVFVFVFVQKKQLKKLLDVQLHVKARAEVP